MPDQVPIPPLTTDIDGPEKMGVSVTYHIGWCGNLEEWAWEMVGYHSSSPKVDPVFLYRSLCYVGRFSGKAAFGNSCD